VEFSGIVDTLTCAVEIQQAVATHHAQIAEGKSSERKKPPDHKL
jgi:hypothetical protein